MIYLLFKYIGDKISKVNPNMPESKGETYIVEESNSEEEDKEGELYLEETCKHQKLRLKEEMAEELIGLNSEGSETQKSSLAVWIPPKDKTKGTSADRKISTKQNDTYVCYETIPNENEKEERISDYCSPGENSENEILPLCKNMPVQIVDQESEHHEYQKSSGDVWIPLKSEENKVQKNQDAVWIPPGKKKEKSTDPDLAENQDETHIDVESNHEEETSEEYICNFNLTKEIKRVFVEEKEGNDNPQKSPVAVWIPPDQEIGTSVESEVYESKRNKQNIEESNSEKEKDEDYKIDSDSPKDITSRTEIESLPLNEAVTEQIHQESESTENQESCIAVWKPPNSYPPSPNPSGSSQHEQSMSFKPPFLEQYEKPQKLQTHIVQTDKNAFICDEALNSTQNRTMKNIPDHDTNLPLNCPSRGEMRQEIQETKTEPKLNTELQHDTGQADATTSSIEKTFKDYFVCVSNMNSKTSENTLSVFMEGRVDGDSKVTYVLFSDDRSLAVVGFSSPIDVSDIQDNCNKKTLQGKYLEVTPINPVKYIIVSGEEDVTIDDLKKYFQDRSESDACKVLRISSWDNGCYSVKFRNEKDALRACKKSFHMVSNTRLTLTPMFNVDHEGSCKGIYDILKHRVPLPGRIMIEVDVHILTFLHQSNLAMEQLNLRLEGKYAKATIKEKLQIECLLNQKTPNVQQLAKSWETEAKKSFFEHFNSIFHKVEFNATEDAWEELETITNNHSSDDIIIIYEKTILKIIFVGEKTAVQALYTDACKQLRKITDKIQREKQIMTEEKCYPVPYIKLMTKMGIFEEIRMKNKDVKIDVDFPTGTITFKGMKEDIMTTRLRLAEEMFKFKNRTIFDVLSKNQLKLLNSKPVKSLIERTFQKNGLTITMEFQDDSIKVYAVNSCERETAVSIIVNMTKALESIIYSVDGRILKMNAMCQPSQQNILERQKNQALSSGNNKVLTKTETMVNSLQSDPGQKMYRQHRLTKLLMKGQLPVSAISGLYHLLETLFGPNYAGIFLGNNDAKQKQRKLTKLTNPIGLIEGKTSCDDSFLISTLPKKRFRPNTCAENNSYNKMIQRDFSTQKDVVVIVAFDISLDLTKLETFVKHLYSKVIDNCGDFVDILVEILKCRDAFLSTIQETKQIPPTAALLVVACAITIDHVKSENYAKILFEIGRIDLRYPKRIAKFWGFADIPENRLKCSDACKASIPKSKQIYVSTDDVGVVSADTVLDNNNKLSNKAIMRERVGLTQTNIKTSNLKRRHEWKIDEVDLDLGCKETNIRSSPIFPEDTTYSKKIPEKMVQNCLTIANQKDSDSYPYEGTQSDIAEVHFKPVTDNKKVSSTSSQKKIILTFNSNDEFVLDCTNKEINHAQPHVTNLTFPMTSRSGALWVVDNQQDNTHGTYEEKSKPTHPEALEKVILVSCTEKQNSTLIKLDKVHNAFVQSEFDTLMDQKIEKTPMESEKKRNNKIKDKVSKLPDVSQKKQSLDEDTKLQTDAMQWDVKEKKPFDVKINSTLSTRFWVKGLLILSLLRISSAGNVCKETVKKVPHCPTASEYQQRALNKCIGVCGDSGENYQYHCVRDSTKTYLADLCAISILSFVDYCVEYDEVGNLIQMDQSTRCNSSSKDSYYNSSKVLFCDPGSCLHLPRDTTNPSTSMTESTTKNVLISTTNSTNTNKGDIKPNQLLESWHYIAAPLLLVSIVVGSVIIFFKYKKHQTNEPSENEEMDQMHPLQAVNHPTTSRLKILLQCPGLNRIRNLFQRRNAEEISFDDVA